MWSVIIITIYKQNHVIITEVCKYNPATIPLKYNPCQISPVYEHGVETDFLYDVGTTFIVCSKWSIWFLGTIY